MPRGWQWTMEWWMTKEAEKERMRRKSIALSITITITRGQECASSEMHISSSEKTINNCRASRYRTTWNKLWPTSGVLACRGWWDWWELYHLHLLIFMKSHTDGDVLLDRDECWRRNTHLGMCSWEALFGRNTVVRLSNYIDLRTRAYAQNRCRPLLLSILPARCQSHVHMLFITSGKVGCHIRIYLSRGMVRYQLKINLNLEWLLKLTSCSLFFWGWVLSDQNSKW